MKIINKIEKILLKPKNFHKEIKKEKDFKDLSKFLTVAFLVYWLLNFMFLSIFTNLLMKTGLLPEKMEEFEYIKNIFNLSMGEMNLLTPVFSFVTLIFGYFITSLIIHLFVKLFEGKGKFKETLKSIFYAATPRLLFSAVPLISLLSLFYEIYLRVIFIKSIHKMKISNAIIATIGSGILFWILSKII